MAHSGFLSKGITISYQESGTTPASYTEIPDLQSIPSLGGSPEKVEVTTLADSEHTYIKGLIEYGDLAFKFLYDNSAATSNYRLCKAMEDAIDLAPETKYDFLVEFPDKSSTGTHGTLFKFSGQPQASIDEVGVNAAPTFTLNIALSSDISSENPD